MTLQYYPNSLLANLCLKFSLNSLIVNLFNTLLKPVLFKAGDTVQLYDTCLACGKPT